MDRRAINLMGLVPGDRVSVPRPVRKGGREIATFICVDPATEEGGLPDAIVRNNNGRLRRYPLWRVRLFVDNQLRRQLQEEEDEVRGVEPSVG